MWNRRTFISNGATAAGIGMFSADAVAEQTQGAEKESAVGGYNYRLPSLETGSRLVFMGDSITDMKWGRNENDRNHYLGHSYVFLIASRLLMDMPAAKLEFFNRGHSGNTLANLKDRWQKDAIDMKPDLLSILIGTNDCGKAPKGGVDLKKWESTYRELLRASRKANPDLRIVLLDPFALKVGKLTDPKTWKKRGVALMRLLPIVEKLATEFGAAHVRTQTVFDAVAQAGEPSHWMWDGIHPLPPGHELISRHWIQEVSARWPKQ